MAKAKATQGTKPAAKPKAPKENAVADAIRALAMSAHNIATAVLPIAAGNKDATGTHVSSLTEAGMGITAGLVRVAHAIEVLAAAVEGLRPGEEPDKEAELPKPSDS